MNKQPARKDTVVVSGAVVGYQFNQKSMGKRTFHLHVDPARGVVYVPALQREVRVRRPFDETTWYWETY